MRLFTLTALALLAFAANSLLCRMALVGGLIDPVTFTTVRLASGALALLPLALVGGNPGAKPARGSWASAAALFAYAIAFSLAYLSLDTGMGALLLFGAVQLTMLLAALRGGERMTGRQWLGFTLAVAGLCYLVWPGLESPDPLGALLMVSAGIAWGAYSLWGRGVSSPFAMTGGNFLRAVPLSLAASLLALGQFEATAQGVFLAALSGALTSGVGYVIWYAALPGLGTSRAAVVQLLVPALAALGGVLVLDELLTQRLLLASGLILGGVGLAVARPWRRLRS